MAETVETLQRRAIYPRRWCYGKTPMQIFIDSHWLAKKKMLAA